MKNYAGNRTLLNVMQTFFLIFIRFISTSTYLSTASISIFETGANESNSFVKNTTNKNEWGKSD